MQNSSLDQVKEAFASLCQLVAQLRDPVSGCPWDLKQDHSTLAKYIVEEAYESAVAMKDNDAEQMCDELGDVLFQVLLNAQVAQDQQTFDITQVIKGVHTKMVRRHPHVFGSDEDRKAREIPQIMQRWEQIKKLEKGESEDKPYMEQKGVHKVFPATTQAAKIGKAARTVQFDWDSPEQVFDVLLDEIRELKDEWKKSKGKNSAELQAELGDVYFSLAQFCRHLDLEPELVATEGNKKFLARFAAMEKFAKKSREDITQLSKERLEELWNEAKRT